MTGPQPLSDEDLAKKLAEFDSIPLFMKSLPSEETDDAALAALQNLAYEGTPDEIALNFKEQGNDYFKGKRYREALGFYTQGIDAKPTDPTMQEALLCNRAACNLELKNYGSVLRDCSGALTINTRSSKAYFRSALALLALERVEEALDCCDRSKMEKDEKERRRQERIQKEKEAAWKLKTAFRERNLIVSQKPEGSSNPTYPTFDQEDPTGKTLVFPVFFLYPQYATSDVISQFVEDTPFSAHLSVMFPPHAEPPSWDVKRQYIDGELIIYAMTHRKRLLKVGKKMSLRDVLNASKAKEGDPHDGLELKDGCLSFAVLPKGDDERRWVEEYKRLRELISRQMMDTTMDECSIGGKRRKDGEYRWMAMSANHKILRTANAPTTSPDETEVNVAQALLDLESNVPELKTELRPLQISAAREVDVRGGKKAIVIFVPVPQLKAFHKVQQRLTRELEKKFSDRHVVFIGQRRMLRKPTRQSRVKQKRPRSRTLTNVHEKILEDLVFPTEIVGKRTRVGVDGGKLLKVFLDSKDATALEYKLDSFSSVYRRLTGKEVVFEFPAVAPEPIPSP
ncbi:40S ribosomal protein S7 [Amanita muscaria]